MESSSVGRGILEERGSSLNYIEEKEIIYLIRKSSVQ